MKAIKIITLVLSFAISIPAFAADGVATNKDVAKLKSQIEIQKLNNELLKEKSMSIKTKIKIKEGSDILNQSMITPDITPPNSATPESFSPAPVVQKEVKISLLSIRSVNDKKIATLSYKSMRIVAHKGDQIDNRVTVSNITDRQVVLNVDGSKQIIGMKIYSDGTQGTGDTSGTGITSISPLAPPM